MDAILLQIDHLIVLMMENRSFDHVLGYLTLEDGRTDVDGLRPGMSNEADGVAYPIHHLATTVFRPDQAPPHDGEAVTTTAVSSGAMSGTTPMILSGGW